MNNQEDTQSFLGRNIYLVSTFQGALAIPGARWVSGVDKLATARGRNQCSKTPESVLGNLAALAESESWGSEHSGTWPERNELNTESTLDLAAG